MINPWNVAACPSAHSAKRCFGEYETSARFSLLRRGFGACRPGGFVPPARIGRRAPSPVQAARSQVLLCAWVPASVPLAKPGGCCAHVSWGSLTALRGARGCSGDVQ